MADDEDAIYIDVIPRVDDSAADSAVSKLKDKFKDVAGDIGPEFMDALGNSGALEQLGTKLGEALSGPLKDLSDGTGLDLKNPLEKMLKQDMGGALDDVASQLGEKLGKAIKDPLENVASTIGVDLDSAVSKALNKDWGGLATDLGKGVGGKIGQALGLEDTLSGLDGILSKAQNIGDVISNFRGGNLSGGLSGAAALFGGSTATAAPSDLTQILGLTGQLGLPQGAQRYAGGLTTASHLLDQFTQPTNESKGVGDIIRDALTHGAEGAGLGALIPGLDATGIPEVIGAVAGGGGSLLHDLLPASKPPDTSQVDARPWAAMALGQSPYSVAPTRSGAGGGGSTTASEVDVQASSAVVSAGSVTLSGGISLPSSMLSALSSSPSASPSTAAHAATSPPPKSAQPAPHAGSIHPNDMSALLGIPGHSTGGTIGGDSPGFDNRIGILPSGSMVGLEGGEGVIRPEAMGRPGVSDLVSMLNQHYDEGTTGSGGVGGDSNNPSLSTPPTQGNSAGSGGGQGTQQQQLGKGQGGGISGGGIIGAAEQAGVAAAGVAGFGGGAIAAQMAVQETNLAVQKTSQSIAALATAPFETFGLQGGMMGAPQVNPMGGWIGKLIAGELGSQTSLPNLAGAVQPPKKPDQKPEDGQQPQGETPSGPSGAKDDPMHVNVTNQPSPQQGTATSAMNVSPAMAMSVP